MTVRDGVLKKEQGLFVMIDNLSSDAARLRDMTLLFRDNCNDVRII